MDTQPVHVDHELLIWKGVAEFDQVLDKLFGVHASFKVHHKLDPSAVADASDGGYRLLAELLQVYLERRLAGSPLVGRNTLPACHYLI